MRLNIKSVVDVVGGATHFFGVVRSLLQRGVFRYFDFRVLILQRRFNAQKTHHRAILFKRAVLSRLNGTKLKCLCNANIQLIRSNLCDGYLISVTGTVSL